MKQIVIFLLLLFSISIGNCSDWIDLSMYTTSGQTWLTSSELEAPSDIYEIGRYSANNLFDGDQSTCWAEGVKGSGIGEKLFMVIPENINGLKFVNGLAKNAAIFKKNNRVKEFKLTIYGGIYTDEDVTELVTKYKCMTFGEKLNFSLQDTPKSQKISISMDWNKLNSFKENVLKEFEKRDNAKTNKSNRYFYFIIELEIIDVYKGSKWDDTCISEIEFLGSPKSDKLKVLKIYTNIDENGVFFDTENNSGIMLIKDKESVFQIIESSADKNWLILIRMPADAGSGRVETEYLLFYLPLKKKIDLNAAGYNVGDMYDFTEENDHIYVNGSDNTTLDDLKIDLNKVLSEIIK
ncbi:hypothetical protein KAH27_06690 [bacterium]|nr:hypothetical protein [bacterium]